MSLQFITTVTYSAVGSVNVDNCFSADYDDYLVLMDQVTSDNDRVTNLFYRAGGVTNVDTNSYIIQYFYAQGSGDAAGRETGSTDNLFFPTASTDTNAMWAHIMNPFNATSTQFRQHQVYGVNTVRNLSVSGTHTTTASFDGFRLVPEGGTMTGTLYVYGYKKG